MVLYVYNQKNLPLPWEHEEISWLENFSMLNISFFLFLSIIAIYTSIPLNQTNNFNSLSHSVVETQMTVSF